MDFHQNISTNSFITSPPNCIFPIVGIEYRKIEQIKMGNEVSALTPTSTQPFCPYLNSEGADPKTENDCPFLQRRSSMHEVDPNGNESLTASTSNDKSGEHTGDDESASLSHQLQATSIGSASFALNVVIIEKKKKNEADDKKRDHTFTYTYMTVIPLKSIPSWMPMAGLLGMIAPLIQVPSGCSYEDIEFWTSRCTCRGRNACKTCTLTGEENECTLLPLQESVQAVGLHPNDTITLLFHNDKDEDSPASTASGDGSAAGTNANDDEKHSPTTSTINTNANLTVEESGIIDITDLPDDVDNGSSISPGSAQAAELSLQMMEGLSDLEHPDIDFHCPKVQAVGLEKCPFLIENKDTITPAEIVAQCPYLSSKQYEA